MHVSAFSTDFVSQSLEIEPGGSLGAKKRPSRFLMRFSGCDVSVVTDMSGLFDFDEDFSHWDISSVTSVHHMFDGTSVPR